MKKNSLVIMTLSASLLPQLASAAQPPQLARIPVSESTQQLRTLLNACDATLDACGRANADKAKVIKDQQTLIDTQAAHIKDLEHQEDKLLNDKYFWLTVGAGATVSVYERNPWGLATGAALGTLLHFLGH